MSKNIRRLTENIQDDNPWNVASYHSEEGAQTANQQAELEEEARVREGLIQSSQQAEPSVCANTWDAFLKCAESQCSC